MTEGRILLKFALQVYKFQLREGRHFLHEHPASASSWEAAEVQQLLRRTGVGQVTGDQCRYGLRTRSPDGTLLPAMEPTRFMSSSLEVLRALGLRCQKLHQHQALVGGRASAAAIYPPGLCRAILEGIGRQKWLEGDPVPSPVLRAVNRGVGIVDLDLVDEDGAPLEVLSSNRGAFTPQTRVLPQSLGEQAWLEVGAESSRLVDEDVGLKALVAAEPTSTMNSPVRFSRGILCELPAKRR